MGKQSTLRLPEIFDDGQFYTELELKKMLEASFQKGVEAGYEDGHEDGITDAHRSNTLRSFGSFWLGVAAVIITFAFDSKLVWFTAPLC